MLSTSSKTKFQYQYLLIAIVIILALVSVIALYQAGVLPAISTGQGASAAVDLSWPPRPDFSQLNEIAIIPVTGSTEGSAVYHSGGWGGPVAVQNSLSQYNLSERGTFAAAQNGMNIYHQSERVQATLVNRNEAGLAQYHLSERGTFAASQNGMSIYHQSEWNAAQVLPAFHYTSPGR